MSDSISRRNFIKGSGMIAVGLVTPAWLSTLARADLIRQTKGAMADPDTILVVCQLSGGNDGLNTVIPYSDALYRSYRPSLAIEDEKVLHLNDQIGLHPGMAEVRDLYKAGKVAIVQNVGYPKPNRSHFKSMDIWQSASPEQPGGTGWLGRHFDQKAVTGPLNPVIALALSKEKPLAIQARKASIPCFASLADIQAMVGDPDAERMLRQIQSGPQDPGSQVVQDANKAALDAMSVLRDKLKLYSPKGQYGEDAFGRGFKQIAHLIAASPQTRVIYFSASGFDTHAHQAEQHEKLLTGFSKAIGAFMGEMTALGKSKQVVVLVFSEFGRRTYENASGGTDHGAAAPMFLIGDRVKGGLYGGLPNLSDLADGDLKFQIDFRQVYATALQEWMGGDAKAVLGSSFSTLDLIR